MIPLFFALLLAQEKASVEGKVVNALSGEPLKKAHVVLDEENRRYTVVSGSEGNSRFEGIEPGEYHLYRPASSLCGRRTQLRDGVQSWHGSAKGREAPGTLSLN